LDALLCDCLLSPTREVVRKEGDRGRRGGRKKDATLKGRNHRSRLNISWTSREQISGVQKKRGKKSKTLGEGYFPLSPKKAAGKEISKEKRKLVSYRKVTEKKEKTKTRKTENKNMERESRAPSGLGLSKGLEERRRIKGISIEGSGMRSSLTP